MIPMIDPHTIELYKQLSKKPKHELEYGLFLLMTQGKIDFLSVQQTYVQYLEDLKRQYLNKLMEAETCVVESLMYSRKPKNEQEEMSVQRRLYLLNQSRRFQMKSLNKKFNYDEERARTYNHQND